jgi:hypothetical protein
MKNKAQHSFQLKATIYVVLMAFLFSQAAPYLTFKTQQYWVKKEIKGRIKRGVPEAELTSFNVNTILNSTGFKWEKYGKEFSFKGNLYDIVKTESTNGILQFKCINDKQEKELFANLDKLIQETSGKSKQGQNNIKTAFMPFVVLDPLVEFVLPDNGISHNTFLPDQKISFVFISVPAPPPNRFG